MLEKPLQESSGDAIVADLLSGGLKHLMADIADAANNDDEIAKRFLDRMWQDGVTDQFALELERNTRDIRVPRTAKWDRKARKYYWQPQWVVNRRVTRKAAYSMILIYVINANKADQIRRCKAETVALDKPAHCENYYFGAANKQWCSDRCGSRVRVRAKRKKDKVRGIL